MAKSTTETPPEAPPRKSPRPASKKLQTLARIDRLFADHTEEERQQMVAWLITEYVHGRFRVVVGSELVPVADGTPPKE